VLYLAESAASGGAVDLLRQERQQCQDRSSSGFVTLAHLSRARYDLVRCLNVIVFSFRTRLFQIHWQARMLFKRKYRGLRALVYYGGFADE